MGLHSIAWRRVALLAGAVLCFMRALAYVPGVRAGPVPEPVWLAAAGHPWIVATYAALWGVAGVLCLAALPTGRLMVACCAVTGMMCLWGTAYLLAWLLQPSTLWWTMGALYLPAGIIIGLQAAIITRRDKADQGGIR